MIDKIEVSIYVSTTKVSGFGSRVPAPEATVEIREASGDASDIKAIVMDATTCADQMLANMQSRAS